MSIPKMTKEKEDELLKEFNDCMEEHKAISRKSIPTKFNKLIK